jgi:hypothetical protein
VWPHGRARHDRSTVGSCGRRWPWRSGPGTNAVMTRPPLCDERRRRQEISVVSDAVIGVLSGG